VAQAQNLGFGYPADGDYAHMDNSLSVSGTLRVGNGGESCDSDMTGAIRYAGGTFEFCSGSSWQSLVAAADGGEPDAIVSGTTSVTANTSGYISLTTGGTTTGYFDTAGRLVVPGISVTTNQASFTTVYVSGNISAEGVSGNWIASQAEAEAGVDNTQVMTPLRVKQAIDVLAGGGATPCAPADVQTFDVSGTWTKPSCGTFTMVECWGGGAGGARNSSTGVAAGGGGGGYDKIFVSSAALPSSVSVVIGVGGASRSTNGVGNNGVSSTFGNYLLAGGGLGGSNSSGNTPGGRGGLGLNSGGFGGGGSVVTDTSCGESWCYTTTYRGLVGSDAGYGGAGGGGRGTTSSSSGGTSPGGTGAYM